MADEPGQDMVRILPNGLGDNQWRIGIDRTEHFHAVFLAIDKAVPLIGYFVSTLELIAEAFDSTL